MAIAVLIWDDYQQLAAQGRGRVFKTESEAQAWIERQDARSAEMLAFADQANAEQFVSAFKEYCQAAWTPNQGSQFQEVMDTSTPAARLDEQRALGEVECLDSWEVAND